MLAELRRNPTVRNLRSAVVGRRGNPRQMHRVGRRRFHFEHLEDRRMLAADFLSGGVLAEGEDDPARVAVHLSTTDLAGHPISSVQAGKRFLLQANIEDLRDNPPGVFAAYVDVEFDANHAKILGPLVHGAGFLNGVFGNIDHPGLIDEGGAFQPPYIHPAWRLPNCFQSWSRLTRSAS